MAPVACDDGEGSCVQPQQFLRDSDAIANNHYVNQTLFHTVCAMTFDEDQGFCAFDRLTSPGQFSLIGAALSGPTSTIWDLALAGRDFIRLPNDPHFSQLQVPVAGETFPILAWDAKDYENRTIPIPCMVVDRLRRLLVEAVKRVLPVALVVFTNPRCTMSAADTAHGVEGLVGADVGHQSPHGTVLSNHCQSIFLAVAINPSLSRI